MSPIEQVKKYIRDNVLDEYDKMFKELIDGSVGAYNERFVKDGKTGVILYTLLFNVKKKKFELGYSLGTNKEEFFESFTLAILGHAAPLYPVAYNFSGTARVVSIDAATNQEKSELHTIVHVICSCFGTRTMMLFDIHENSEVGSDGSMKTSSREITPIGDLEGTPIDPKGTLGGPISEMFLTAERIFEEAVKKGMEIPDPEL